MSGRGPLVGIYPGTFDPITLGHMDIISRATKVVDRLVIAVASNVGKGPLFTPEERVQMIQDELGQIETNGVEAEVHAFDNLLMHFAQQVGARVILRGLRAVSDFEYEFQMACMNTRMNPEVETVFLTASERQQFISSRFVKEIGSLGGDIRTFVTPNVADRLEAKFAENRGERRSLAGGTAGGGE